jgi:hypothetical protein
MIASSLMTLRSVRAENLQLRGDPSARGLFGQLLQDAVNLRSREELGYFPFAISLRARYSLVILAQSEQELAHLLAQSDQDLARCKEFNQRSPQCVKTHFQIYVQAAWCSQLWGQDPQERLMRARDSLAEVRKLGGTFLEVEQHDALLRYIMASRTIRDKQDPSPVLNEMQAALKRCLALEPEDRMCRTLAIRKGWIESEWLALSHKKTVDLLEDLLQRSLEVAQGPEVYPDAWQVVAETQLRLSRAQTQPALRELHIAAGLEAVGKALATNPRLTMGRVTASELYLLRAEAATRPDARRAAAQSAVSTLDRMLKEDPSLTPAYAPLLAKAQALGSTQ